MPTNFLHVNTCLPVALKNSRFVPNCGNIIRSDSVDILEIKDFLSLYKMGVTDIISLRSPKHNVVSERIFATPIHFHNFPLINHWEKFTIQQKNETDYTEMYLDVLSQTEAIQQIFNTIVNAEGRVLIYCMQGKDRTGMISFLIEMLCGLSKENIISDYTKSKKIYPERSFTEKIISEFYDSFKRKYGTAEKYLNSLGYDLLFTNRLKQKLNQKIFFISEYDNHIHVCLDAYYKCFSVREGIAFLVKILRANKEYQHLSATKKQNGCKLVSSTELISICFSNNAFRLEAFGMQIFCTAEEFKKLVEKIHTFLNTVYCQNWFDIKDIDAFFLEDCLGIDLPFLISAHMEECFIEDLRCFSLNDENGIPISKGRYYQQLSENRFINEPNHKNNLTGQTNEERLKEILRIIQDEGYGTNHRYAVVYNEEMIIRDGEHRIAALYYLYGNIKIKILRMKFCRNYYCYSRYYHEKEGEN